MTLNNFFNLISKENRYGPKTLTIYTPNDYRKYGSFKRGLMNKLKSWWRS